MTTLVVKVYKYTSKFREKVEGYLLGLGLFISFDVLASKDF